MSHATLTAVGGGACVGDVLRGSIGNRDIFAALIQQSNTTITATVSSQGNQTSCAYAGTTSGTTVNLSLTFCQAGPGTSTSTWNVLTAGSTAPVAVLTLSAEFRWTQHRHSGGSESVLPKVRLVLNCLL